MKLGKKILRIIVIFLFMILLNNKVQAASTSITGPTNAKVGDNITITAKVTAGAWNLVFKGAGQTKELVGQTSEKNNVNVSTSISFTATQVGSYTFTLSGDISDYFTDVTDPISKTYTVNISATDTGGSTGGASGNTGSSGNSGSTGTTTTPSKSNNANLKNLGIRPNDFTGFKANTTTYNVTVPYSVESVEVYAQVQDSKAKITSGTGTKRLKEGSNSLPVVVTAEDGTKKTYTINVVRMSEEEEMIPNVIEEDEEKPETLRLTAISLQNDLNLTLSPAFDSETFEYTVEVESDLEALELSGIPNVNGATVEITGNEGLVEGENIITITVKADGYEDVVYTIKVIKKATEEVVAEEEQVQGEPTAAELDNSIANKKIILVISIIAFIIIAIVVILVLRSKKNNKKLYSSYYDYYNDYPNETEKLDVLKEMEENNNTVNENVFEESEVTEGYTAEIEDDPEYEEKPRRKKGKGKHF